MWRGVGFVPVPVLSSEAKCRVRAINLPCKLEILRVTLEDAGHSPAEKFLFCFIIIFKNIHTFQEDFKV